MDRSQAFPKRFGLEVLAVALLPSVTPIAAKDNPGLPDLHIAAKDLGDARKYVVFHKPGVTVEQAEADLRYCYAFLPHGVARTAPGFVPWTKTDATNPVVYSGGNYGLVGYGIASIIDGPLERSIRQSRLYQCMIPKGYDRYRTSEDIWKLMNEKNNSEGIKLQAQIAAGPPPPTPKAEP